MKNTFKLGLLLIGALALSLTLATAEGKCGDSQKGMMDNDGKCGNSQKGMMDNDGRCGNSQKSQKCDGSKGDSNKRGMMDNDGRCGADGKPKEEPKPAPTKGKCGQGKCG